MVQPKNVPFLLRSTGVLQENLFGLALGAEGGLELSCLLARRYILGMYHFKRARSFFRKRFHRAETPLRVEFGAGAGPRTFVHFK